MAVGPQSVQVVGHQIPVSNPVSVEVIRFGYQRPLPASFLLSGVLGRGQAHKQSLPGNKEPLTDG